MEWDDVLTQMSKADTMFNINMLLAILWWNDEMSQNTNVNMTDPFY